jgi:hypothetical protein
MRSWGWLAVLVPVFVSLDAVPGSPPRCHYPPDTAFVAGHDEKGYFVRADWQDDRFRPTKGSVITGVGDFLAREAGSTIVYVSLNTAKGVQRGEWRAADPLRTLKLFAEAAGLEVRIPSPGYWVIGAPDMWPSSGLTLSVQSLDPAGQGFGSVDEKGAIEKALVDQLPVRDTGNDRGRIALDVAYYRIPGESPETWLVLSSLAEVESSNPYSPFFKAFKVGLARTGRGIEVECLWASSHATGRLVPEIAEDLDGDGVRDFVFQGAGDKHPDSILSGNTGRLLVDFIGNEIAVEKAAVGPRRFAVDTLVGMEVEGKKSLGTDAWTPGPFILTFDPPSADFNIQDDEDVREEMGSGVHAPGGQFNGPRKLLARALGGTHKMRVYLLEPGVSFGNGGAYEEVPQQRYWWNVEPTPAAIAKGYPARILLRYGPGALKAKGIPSSTLRGK